ncbi:hypothetical protein U1Q18_043284 [Sarracenia purpurea var. burkii]
MAVEMTIGGCGYSGSRHRRKVARKEKGSFNEGNAFVDKEASDGLGADKGVLFELQLEEGVAWWRLQRKSLESRSIEGSSLP